MTVSTFPPTPPHEDIAGGDSTHTWDPTSYFELQAHHDFVAGDIFWHQIGCVSPNQKQVPSYSSEGQQDRPLRTTSSEDPIITARACAASPFTDKTTNWMKPPPRADPFPHSNSSLSTMHGYFQTHHPSLYNTPDASPISTPPLSLHDQTIPLELTSSSVNLNIASTSRSTNDQLSSSSGSPIQTVPRVNTPVYGTYHARSAPLLQQPPIKREARASSSLTNYPQGPRPYSYTTVPSSSTARPRRITGACSRCRRLKMKCEFKEHAPACTRCTLGKHECILEEKKPRNPGERERLLARLRQREAQVQSLIDNLKDEVSESTPLTFVPSKVKLSEEQKEQLRPVLLNATSQRSKPTATQLGELRAWLEAEEWTSSGSDAISDTSSTSSTGTSDDSNPASRRRATSVEQNDGIPSRQTPMGLIARTTLEEQSGNTFFTPGPMTDHNLRAIMLERGESTPNVLIHGLFSFDDIEILFDIFFRHIYPIVGMLDPDIHTPAAVLVRSPFLFTVICAIASRFLRFHPARVGTTDLYPLAMHYAKTAAASAMIDGSKTIESCQAYLLMCLYAPKGKRFDEDKSWFYSGVAMRLATDLGLHNISEQPAGSDERTIREWNNRVRTWFVCFNIDRSFASQYGRPATLKEDRHTRNRDWYKRPFTTNYDIHAVAHTALLRIVARFHETIEESRTLSSEALAAAVNSFEGEINTFSEDLQERYDRDSDPNDEGARFRASMKLFSINHFYLMVLSQGLQSSFDAGVEPDQFLLMKALHAATTVVKSFLAIFTPNGFLRYLPDCHFVYCGYAAIFLLKLVDSQTYQLLDHNQNERIIELVSTLVHTLSSPEVVIDEGHTPKLYAGFLSGLLNRVSRQHAIIHPAGPADSVVSSSSSSSDVDYHQAQQQQQMYSPVDQSGYMQPYYAQPTVSTSWDTTQPVYDSPMETQMNVPSYLTGTVPYTQDLGTHWNYPYSGWTMQNMCPDVTYLTREIAPNEIPLPDTPYAPPHSRQEYF